MELRLLFLVSFLFSILVALTADSDTSDLLGGFEQVDIARVVSECLQRCLDIGSSLLSYALSSNLISALCVLEPLMSSIRAFSRITRSMAANNNRKESRNKRAAAIGTKLLELWEQLGIQEEIEDVQALRGLIPLLASEDTVAAGKFEWVDGPLVKALEDGHWIILESANLCNASVLDRLNPLLEPVSLFVAYDICYCASLLVFFIRIFFFPLL